MRMTARVAACDTPSKAWARALAYTAPIARNPDATLSTQINDLAETFGDRPALIGKDVTLSYRALAARANRFARWALAQGLGRGDVVCLLMHNCPEYFAAWLGITRTGAIAALVNTNLVGDSLTHAIRAASPKCIVVGADLAETVAAARAAIESAVPCWVQGTDGCVHDMSPLESALEAQLSMPLKASECAPPSTRDPALYIYTSGTTGLPKAAVVSHHRVLQWSY
jgi:fatty-acyl-CoA synthase